MHLLNTKLLPSLRCPLNAVFLVIRGTVRQDAGTPLILQLQIYNLAQEPLNPRTNHGKIRISIDGRFWPLLLQ
jgi:hypothetical protein